MDKKYFNVIRVYPSIKDVYSYIGLSSEFLDMEGLDRWTQLRQSNSIKENLDVYTLKDLGVEDMVRIKSELNSYPEKYFKQAEVYKLEYYNSKLTEDDYKKYNENLINLLNTVNSEFTDYLKSHYTKLEV